MRFIFVAHSVFPLTLIDPKMVEEPCLVITHDASLGRLARRRGFRAVVGPLYESATYRRARLAATDRILMHLHGKREIGQALKAIFIQLPQAPVTFLLGLQDKPIPRWEDSVRFVGLDEVVGTLRPELEKAAARKATARLRAIFEDAERVLLLVQDDPDPDGIASAVALRALLGRNRLSAPIGSFGEVTRPENLAMIRLLDIQVNRISTADLRHFDRIALLDVQPFHSPDIPTEVDAIIDHHPKRSNYTSQFADIRPRYGATATIMTEYLTASGVAISQRLATALVYGIKTDTQLLGRDTTPMDVEAFANLYPLSNHALLRRIDRPQIPRDDLQSVSAALADAQIVDDVIYAHLGPLTREDLVPYFADLCLEVEKVEWSVASGLFEGQLIISIRNYGLGRSAGDVVKAAFEQYGPAGGHRAMAKAVLPLDHLPESCLDHGEWIRATFAEALAIRDGGLAE